MSLPVFTIGWWNEFAAAACGQPAVLAVAATEAMAVRPEPDLSVTVKVWQDSIRVPRHLVLPLIGALECLDALPSPIVYHCTVSPELSLELQDDATVVIVIGADDEPAHAIEVPGVKIEALKESLLAIVR